MNSLQTRNDETWVKTYGFSMDVISDKTSFIKESVAKGEVVGDWTKGLKVYTDPQKNSGRLSRWSSEGIQIAEETPIPLIENFWQMMEYFGEGDLDCLVLGNHAIHFPKTGRALLEKIKKSPSAPSDESLVCPDPKEPFLLNLYGKALAFSGRINEAGQAFTTAAMSLPEFSEPYGNLGALLWQAGKQREAFILLTEALSRNPLSVSAQLNFFDAGRELEEFGMMSQVLEALIPQAPQVLEFKHHLAVCYHRLGRNDEALKTLLEILEADPTDPEAKNLYENFKEGNH